MDPFKYIFIQKVRMSRAENPFLIFTLLFYINLYTKLFLFKMDLFQAYKNGHCWSKYFKKLKKAEYYMSRTKERS